MGWESCGVVGFDLGPLLQGQTRIAKLKSAYNSLIMGPRGLQCETKLWEIMGWESCGVVGFDLGPLLQRFANCETKLWEIMGWESCGVVGFDLGPLLQGQMRIAKLKMLIAGLLLVLEVWDGKPTYRKSWAGNLVVWSDLTLGPSFKVKRG